MARYVFHVLPNAHLDPVWLWDWREGLNEGLVTTRTILDLMDEDPELTFMRGEAALYEHIERTDPATFRRLEARVAEGRWDVVGGTYLQADTNLPATETFAHHFALGMDYFRRTFGRTPTVAWAADSFGHSAGLVEILAAAGMEGFSFSRPGSAQVPLVRPAFWWEAASGARVLGYRVPSGWYGCERDEVPRRLDGTLAEAERAGLENVGVYIGLGDHGGGPTRRHLAEVRAWARAHAEVTLVWSGLHRLVRALRAEAAAREDGFLPVHRGELNYCLRGCYASVARLKLPFRRAEATLCRAERLDAAVAALRGTAPAELGPAWKGLLFNSFHDVLPGSSIERAYDDQLAWLGGSVHQAQAVELDAVNALAADLDTSVAPVEIDHPAAVPLVVVNPHPWPYDGPIELEASLDYRPIWAYNGRPGELPIEVLGPDGAPHAFQEIETEHSSMVGFPWRKRVVLRGRVPPLGWAVYCMGWVEGARRPTAPGAAARPDGSAVSCGSMRVTARVGDDGIEVLRDGVSLFGPGALSAVTVEDPWGSWGTMDEQPQEALDLSVVRHRWQVTEVAVLEPGPQRATLGVRLEGGRSELELRLSLCADRQAVDVQARLQWNERSARLKLVLPLGAREALFEVPGGVVRRGPAGEVPGGRWVKAQGRDGDFGFASDGLYCFDLHDGALRVTVVRATRYANDVPTGPAQDPWRPATDRGEHRFRMLLVPGGAQLERLSSEMEMPPFALLTAPHAGTRGRTGSLMSLQPASLRLLALKPATDGRGVVLRLQQADASAAQPQLTFLGSRVALDEVPGWRIQTYRLSRQEGGWRAARTTIAEE